MKESINQGLNTVRSNGKWVSKADMGEFQDQIMDTARQVYDAALKAGSVAMKRVNTNANSLVKQYPMQVAVGALAIGFVVGTALTRRFSKAD